MIGLRLCCPYFVRPDFRQPMVLVSSSPAFPQAFFFLSSITTLFFFFFLVPFGAGAPVFFLIH